MAKQGIKAVIHIMGWTLKGMAWVLLHILKLALAVLEVALLLTGNVLKMMMLVFHAGQC